MGHYHIEKNNIDPYLEGLLSDGQAHAIKRHLSECRECRQTMVQHKAINAVIKDNARVKLKVTIADKRLLLSSIRKNMKTKNVRHSFPILRWSAGFVAVAILLAAFFIFQPSRSVTVLSCKGDVSGMMAGKTRVIRAGDFVKRETILTTAHSSECLLAFGGNIMQLPENSSLSLRKLKKHGMKYDIAFDLLKGRIISNIKDKKIIASLVVRDGESETRVKGTIFMVEKGVTGESIVSVLKGCVSVLNKDKKFEVDSDRKLLLGSSGKATASDMTSSDRDLYNAVINIKLYYSVCWSTPFVSEAGIKIVSDENIVYTVSKQGYVTAFKKATGELLWHVKAGAEITSDPALENGRLYVNSSDGYCYVIENGEIKNRLSFGPFAYSAPVLQNGILYFANTKGIITAWAISTEKVIWQKKMDSPILSNMTIEKGVIIACTMAGTLNAVSLDGILLWSYALSGRLIESPAAFLDGDVVIGTSIGDVYRVNISSGRQVWKKHLAQQLDQPVRVVDGLVIICSEKMTALDGNGIVKWTRSLSGTDMFVTETGLMVSDGHIYILDQQTGETKFIYSKEKSVSVYASRNDIFMTKEGNFEKIN